ncbi:MAG: hypothetical protein JF587_04040 [Catenulisporales bacterium]|nr:hypothetical protein [Catenulisporales bacterium]
MIVHAPANERFRQVVDAAVPAEEPGFDGFGIGERHERPSLSCSPTARSRTPRGPWSRPSKGA